MSGKFILLGNFDILPHFVPLFDVGDHKTGIVNVQGDRLFW
jgi:hypothetical protein